MENNKKATVFALAGALIFFILWVIVFGFLEPKP